MVPNIDNKRNRIRQSIKLVVHPPPPTFIDKANTGTTIHYFTIADSHALVILQPNNIGTRV